MTPKKVERKRSKRAPGPARRTRRSGEQLLSDLEAKLASVQARVAKKKRKAASAKASTEEELPRFSPTWLASHRERVQLSAADYGLLVGVSTLTIYNWEKGRTRPQRKQLEALAAVRGLSRRAAWDRLEEMGY